MSSSFCRTTASRSQLLCLLASTCRSSTGFHATKFFITTKQSQSSHTGHRQFSSVHDVPTTPSLSSASHVQSHTHGADIASASSKSPPPPPRPIYPSPKSSLSNGSARSPLDIALNATHPRTDWAREEIGAIYETPLMELAYSAVGCLSLFISK